MMPLDRAFLSSYGLFVVTAPLPVTVWPELAFQILTWFERDRQGQTNRATATSVRTQFCLSPFPEMHHNNVS